VNFVALKPLLGIFSFALTVRLLFSFWLSKYYYGKLNFTFGDSFSYTESIKNLIHFGAYTFDINTPEAYLCRGPIYPFFWGVHYLIFGENAAYAAVAVSQSVLDSASAILIYLIVYKLTGHQIVSLLCAAFYAIFPTFIVYVPITGSETFATFVTLVTIAALIYVKRFRGYLMVGILCGLATMTRQYLGLLLVTSVVYVFISNISQTRHHPINFSAILLLGFVMCVAPWFLRNWINHDTPTILMGKTGGYKEFQFDYIAAENFYNLFLSNIAPAITSIARYGRDGIVDRQILGWQQVEIDRLSWMAMRCGPSFRYIRQWFPEHQQSLSDHRDDCTKELVVGYTTLREKYLEQFGVRLWMTVPSRNIVKSIFKDQLTNPLSIEKDRIIRLIFTARSLFVILGLCSFLFLRRKENLALLIFPLGLIIYISIITRHVEIRYLVQSDALLLGLAMVTVTGIISKRLT
jgi:4-amino-4-deoxy-L-arabinose transferase-like glycosyltransferase